MALSEIKRNRKKVAAAWRREYERVDRERTDVIARRKRGERVAYPSTPHARKVSISASVHQTAGNGGKHNYNAMVCLTTKISSGSLRAAMAGAKREGRSSRYGYGEGRTPTAAIKKALHRLATKLK